MKTCNDRKEERERGAAGKRERGSRHSRVVCVCAKAKQWQMSLLTFFAPSSKTSLHPGPAPLTLSCLQLPPSHSLHAHCQPWTMTQTMIFTFFICLRKVFLPFFCATFAILLPIPPSPCLRLSPNLLFCLRKFALKLELKLSNERRLLRTFGHL